MFKRSILGVLALIVFVPVFMSLAWYFTPKTNKLEEYSNRERIN